MRGSTAPADAFLAADAGAFTASGGWDVGRSCSEIGHVRRVECLVERCINALKASGAVATRYDKRAYVFHGTVTLAALCLWIRP